LCDPQGKVLLHVDVLENNASALGDRSTGGALDLETSASAVIANITVTNAGAPSFFTVYPSTASRPLASDLNWVPGQTIPNLTVASLGTTGAINIYNAAGSADVVVDLFGYFA